MDDEISIDVFENAIREAEKIPNVQYLMKQIRTNRRSRTNKKWAKEYGYIILAVNYAEENSINLQCAKK